MFAVKGIVQGNVVVVNEELLPFDGREVIVTVLDVPEKPDKKNERVLGLAKGKFVCPDDFDEDNELIAQWFEGKE